MKVKIYSTPTCPYCRAAKNFLKGKGIDFVDVDVTTSEDKVQEMIELSGQMGVPVIVIDKKIVVGFDQKELEKIIAK